MRRILLLAVVYLWLGGMLAADGFIVVPPPPDRPGPLFPLEVKYHRVQAEIRDLLAETTVEQEFYNPGDRRLEGYYLFPMPKDGMIKNFSLWIDGRETPAEMLDAARARRIYEDIVRRQRDPALLEYGERGLFRVRVFPIEPRSTRRIRLVYRELLTQENATVEYVYPLNTEKFSARPLGELTVRVTVQSGSPLRNVLCPTHNAGVRREGANRAVVALEERLVLPDRDLKVYFSTAAQAVGFSLLSYKRAGEDGFFLLSAAPALEENGVLPKDVVFVCDTSGSMAGEPLRQVQNALRFCIGSLNPADRFALVRFATEAESLWPRLQANSAENRRRAVEFVGSWRALGGTHIEEALQTALGLRESGERPFLVVFVTDGKPTLGETDENRLLEKIGVANTAHTRIFTFGIGFDLNTHLLDRLTEATRAFRSYITPGEDIEIKISDFFRKLQAPVLTDVKVEFGADTGVHLPYPAEPPDLFRGSPMVLLGRYRRPGPVEVTLRGRAGGRAVSHTFRGELTAGSSERDFLPALWAGRRIGALLDRVRLHGDNRELIEEITQLARQYGIITPYTSYLIVEDEQRRLERGESPASAQTLRQWADPTGNAYADARRKAEGGVREKSGADSVAVSRESQKMQAAESLGAGRPSAPLALPDRSGRNFDVASQVRQVAGRAFYQVGNQWVDGRAQQVKNPQVQRVKFASAEYFTLLQRHPDLQPILALGRNVVFLHGRQLLEVFD